jgi:hypothetical protein
MKPWDFVGIAAVIVSSSAAPSCKTYLMQPSASLEVTDGSLFNYSFKSREAGERDLSVLVNTSIDEEAWLFVEQGVFGVWYDVGEDISPVSARLNTRLAIDVISEHAKISDNSSLHISVTSYHIHTKGSLHASFLSNYVVFCSDAVRDTMTSHLLEFTGVPSDNDFVFQASLRMFVSQYHGSSDVSVRPAVVFTPWGSFMYDLSSVVMEDFLRDGPDAVSKVHADALKDSSRCFDMDCVASRFDSRGLRLRYDQRVAPDMKNEFCERNRSRKVDR